MLCHLFFVCSPQVIALVMVSIGVYARMMKHAGKDPPQIQVKKGI